MALSHCEVVILQGTIIKTSWRRGGKKAEGVGIEEKEEGEKNEQRGGREDGRERK